MFGFNDNPEKRVTWSASGKLPALRTNSCRIYSPYHRRFMTLRERLTAMGFAVYPELAAQSYCSAVQNVSSHMAGNAMRIPNVIMVLAVCMACTRFY